MADRGPDRNVRNFGDRPTAAERDSTGPTDAGRTSGGGSLGHAPTRDVNDEAPLRNIPGGATPTGSTDDPVMPADDATLRTKI